MHAGADAGADERSRGREDERAIRELTERWVAAVTAKDIDRLLAYVTDDVVFLAPSVPPIVGRAAVGSMYRAVFAQFDVRQNPAYHELQLLGDWAFAWGTDALTFTPVAGGAPVHLEGNALSIMRRGDDGAWRFARGINNLMRSAPAEGPPRTGDGR
jgi:uncharacterized protein (TIGR02246 family)